LTPTEQPSHDLLGRRLGDFTLLELVGEGAQSRVFTARQESLGRPVAVKVLKAELFSHDKLVRFQREAEVMARLTHPHTVVVHAVGEQDGVHYIAQELVPEGLTLARKLREARRAGDPTREWYGAMAELVAHVADALHAAHELGVVHRDVKPGNILIMPDGRPKVGDFGLALVEADLEHSQPGLLVGTLPYMCPEQVEARREDIDRRSDVFSLGATLYEALTLERPFASDSLESLRAQIVSMEPRHPRRVRPQLPRDLAVICLKALEKRRERRYQTAAAMAADLRRYLRGESIVARPPSTTVKVARWGRRHPVASTAGLVGLAALVVVVMLVRERDEAIRRSLEAERRFDALTEESGGRMHDRRAAGGGAGPDKNVLDRKAGRLSVQGYSADRFREYLTVGAGYAELAWPEQAAHWLGQAERAAREALDGESAQSVVDLGLACLEVGRHRRLTGRFDEAGRFYEEADRLFVRIVSSDSLVLLDVAIERARLARDEARLADAEVLFTELLRRALAVGADAERLSVFRQSLADVLLERGRLEEARRELEEARELAGREGLDPLIVVRIDGDLARCHDMLGEEADRAGRPDDAARHDEQAGRLYEESESTLRGLKGEPDLELAAMMANRGQFLRRHGQREEARSVLESALEQALLAGGERHATTLYVRNNLATVLHQLDQLEAARGHWEAIIAADAVQPVSPGWLVVLARYGLAAVDYVESRRAEDGAGRLRHLQAACDNIREALAREPPGGPRRTRLKALDELIAGELDELPAVERP
jgi:tetratricopeptide (TPR) repeat protein/tRNA A-37 threonylcarbamoyl transferase component Bud32